jgi:hypothetical protein
MICLGILAGMEFVLTGPMIAFIVVYIFLVVFKRASIARNM